MTTPVPEFWILRSATRKGDGHERDENECDIATEGKGSSAKEAGERESKRRTQERGGKVEGEGRS